MPIEEEEKNYPKFSQISIGGNLQVIFKYLHAEKGPVRLKASENKAMHMARGSLKFSTRIYNR